MEELIFQYLSVPVDADQVSTIFNRPHGTVAILLRNRDGQWVLGRKSRFYPEGIVRMVGGGIDPDEHPAQAAQRELKEETDLDIDSEKLIPLVHAEVSAKDGQNYSVFVFYAQTYADIQPSDDIDQLVYYADRDLNDLVSRYAQLPDDQPIKPDQSCTWAHYGQIWGPIHAAALARVKDLSL